MIGIIGYGAYIPNFRLKVEDIWEVWTDPVDTPAVINAMRGLKEKAVCRWDEDIITMGIYASKAGLEIAGISGPELNAIYLGSCTNPYTSKASAPIIAEALGTGPELMCSDCQFATKSGTVALQLCAAVIGAGMARYALAIGADVLSRHVPPNDPMEYSASSGAAAFVLGQERLIAEIEGMYSYTTQTPDFFRLDGERYIKHAAAEVEEVIVGYNKHIKESIKGYMKKFGCKPGDFDYIALSQPDGQIPVAIGKELGFTDEQIIPGLISTKVGDCGSASPLLALENLLDQAKSGERILMASYGFGAGCDVIGVRTTDLLDEARRRRNSYPSVQNLLDNREYISYAQYLRQERKLIQEFI
jgi:3-hydroxy-3-methylglutaryl CoA synthase